MDKIHQGCVKHAVPRMAEYGFPGRIQSLQATIKVHNAYQVEREVEEAAQFLLGVLAALRLQGQHPLVHPLESGEHKRTAHRRHKRTKRNRYYVGLPLAEVGQQEFLARLEKEQPNKREQGYLQPGQATEP